MKTKQKIYLISIVTVVGLIGLNKMTTVICPQIDLVKGDSLFHILKTGLNLILSIGIWFTGFFLSKKIKLEKANLIIYFVVLSVISVNGIVREIWFSQFSKSKNTVKSICEKSKDDGMIFEFESLTNGEYNYLAEESNWLPKSPPKANNINISFYRDEFLGDYSLKIEIELPINELIDTTKYPNWTKIITEDNFVNKFMYSQG